MHRGPSNAISHHPDHEILRESVQGARANVNSAIAGYHHHMDGGLRRMRPGTGEATFPESGSSKSVAKKDVASLLAKCTSGIGVNMRMRDVETQANNRRAAVSACGIIAG
ncbi:MAG: hypothetical protein KDA91_17150 [Planctomycetaceae bacterium]|nr:hypothetical protein [Planctomycetaceae bacterium]